MKETYCTLKETYHSLKETYQRPILCPVATAERLSNALSLADFRRARSEPVHVDGARVGAHRVNDVPTAACEASRRSRTAMRFILNQGPAAVAPPRQPRNTLGLGVLLSPHRSCRRVSGSRCRTKCFTLRSAPLPLRRLERSFSWSLFRPLYRKLQNK